MSLHNLYPVRQWLTSGSTDQQMVSRVNTQTKADGNRLDTQTHKSAVLTKIEKQD